MRAMNFEYLAQIAQQEDSILHVCSNEFLEKNMSALGLLIHQKRKKYELTHAQFANKCGIDFDEVVAIECDINYEPDIRSISYIAKFLKVDTNIIAELAGYKKDRNNFSKDELYRFAANTRNTKNDNGVTTEVHEQIISVLQNRVNNHE